MTAAELRIGNWYKNMSNDNPFNQIKYGHEIDYVAIYCEPIPLTEEWLLKFGFEKSGINHIKWTKWKMFLVEDEKGIYSFDLGRIYNDILTIHQLQNLYFALTNEELKISEL